MAFTEFCCRSGGSNLNAGTRTGDSTEPGTAADLTYASGDWVQATGVFTVASGDPDADGVAVGDFASVYADGSTVTGYVGRVTARTTTTITVSSSVLMGAKPSDGTGNRTLKIGGAWAGPSGAVDFPFGVVAATAKNLSGNPVRTNLKNDQQYDITAVLTHSLQNTRFEGYGSAYGDGGRAVIDGGTAGASYSLLTSASVAGIEFAYLTFQNNGASGSADGVTSTGTVAFQFFRCVFHDLRGSGLVLRGGGSTAIECEAYNCNQSNTAGKYGINASGTTLLRCISHDNPGSNSSGIDVTGGRAIDCIAHRNGSTGISGHLGNGVSLLRNCDAYDNGGSGIVLAASGSNHGIVYCENCNALKNGLYGFDATNTAPGTVFLHNCGVGSGTQANTSGGINSAAAAKALVESDTVAYAAGVTPWVDPDNGDFRINLAAAKNAGRGAFTQTAASYAGTVGYPDIGAAQHEEPTDADIAAAVWAYGDRTLT